MKYHIRTAAQLFCAISLIASGVLIASAELTDDYIEQGVSTMLQGNAEQAIAYFTKAIESDPKSQFAYYNRCFANSASGKYKEAIEDCRKAVQINPDFAEAYTVMGGAFALSGDPGQALQYCNKALELDPSQAHYYQNRALAYFYQGDYANSWQDVHKAEEMGSQVSPKFLKNLMQLSGRQR
jgi:tetratricopeptide (TPR) repeat protein